MPLFYICFSFMYRKLQKSKTSISFPQSNAGLSGVRQQFVSKNSCHPVAALIFLVFVFKA